MDQIRQKILEILKGSEQILLVSHMRPDGDAIGSILGMYGLIRNNLGKEPLMAVSGPMPAVAAVLPDAYKIQDAFWPEGIDTVVILDCSGWARTGFFETDQLNINWPKNLIVIDHHEKGSVTEGVHIIEPDKSSVAEMVFDLAEAWNMPVTPDIATCLWAGIITDTSSFRHSNTTEKTLRVGAKLMQEGAEVEKVYEMAFGRMSPAGLKLWGRVLSRMAYSDESRVLAGSVYQSDLMEVGASTQDIDGLVGMMNRVAGIRMAMLVVELEDRKWKVSLRTEDETLNVADIAKQFGGGGHARAAGFYV